VHADEKLTAFVELVKGDYEFALDPLPHGKMTPKECSDGDSLPHNR